MYLHSIEKLMCSYIGDIILEFNVYIVRIFKRWKIDLLELIRCISDYNNYEHAM